MNHIKKDQRIRTILYNDQLIYPGELELLHTPALQRLYDLHQLGFADRVYIDASHSRFQHVVGTLHQAEKITRRIHENVGRINIEFFNLLDVYGNKDMQVDIFRKKLLEDYLPVIRLIGLLHDITHSPFGHTLEDEIHLFESKHDEPARQADMFYILISQYVSWKIVESGVKEIAPEYVSDNMIKMEEYILGSNLFSPPNSECLVSCIAFMLESHESKLERAWLPDHANTFRTMLARMKFAMDALLHLELLHNLEPKPKHFPSIYVTGEKYQYQHIIETSFRNANHGRILDENTFIPSLHAFMLDIIGNTVCADLLDYANRDTLHSNIKLAFDNDRIVENFIVMPASFREIKGETDPEREVPSLENKQKLTDPFQGRSLRTAICLFFNKFRADVPGELMNLLNIRYYIYERAIYHQTKCAAGAMLGTALQLIGFSRTHQDDSGSLKIPQDVYFVGDNIFIYLIFETINYILDSMNKIKYDMASTGKTLLNQLPEGASLTVREIAKYLLTIRNNESLHEIKNDFIASRSILNRIISRRYYKPGFRLLAKFTTNSNIYLSHYVDFLRDSQLRFKVERKIEEQLRLPKGSVVLHCPKKNAGEKIANALLALPNTKDGKVKHCAKLRDIQVFDKVIAAELFRSHQKAVRAVEEMYGSMWRLCLYIDPKEINRLPEIMKITAKIIEQEILAYIEEPEAELTLEADPLFLMEMNLKYNLQRGNPNLSIDVPIPPAHMTGSRLWPDGIKNIEDLIRYYKEKRHKDTRLNGYEFHGIEKLNSRFEQLSLKGRELLFSEMKSAIDGEPMYVSFNRRDPKDFEKFLNEKLFGYQEDYMHYELSREKRVACMDFLRKKFYPLINDDPSDLYSRIRGLCKSQDVTEIEFRPMVAYGGVEVVNNNRNFKIYIQNNVLIAIPPEELTEGNYCSPRQLFTLCHEIAHTYFYSKVNGEYYMEQKAEVVNGHAILIQERSFSTEEIEFMCSRLAGYILLTKADIDSISNGSGVEATLRKWRKLGVPIPSIIIRLQEAQNREYPFDLIFLEDTLAYQAKGWMLNMSVYRQPERNSSVKDWWNKYNGKDSWSELMSTGSCSFKYSDRTYTARRIQIGTKIICIMIHSPK